MSSSPLRRTFIIIVVVAVLLGMVAPIIFSLAVPTPVLGS